MANYINAYNITLKHEGGYVNDPDDNGGETYRGIARKFFPNWIGWITIDTLKKQGKAINSTEVRDALEYHVQNFYKQNFWDTMSGDAQSSQSIAEELFDTAVNQGLGTAIKYLQEALNLLNRNETNYKDIVVDGKFGPATLGALNNFKEPKILFNLLNILQAEKYVNICRRNDTQEKFLRGWLGRVTIIKS